jgi:hypothetical protein
MRLNILIAAFFAATALFPAAGYTQSTQVTVDIKHQLQAARNKMDKERRIILASELRLTPTERENFWPLYNEYREDTQEANDMRARLILDYADNYDHMTEEFADRMLSDYFEYSKSIIKIRERYVRRFKKILPSTKVARLYQVENKLDAVLNFKLAAQIPVVQDAGRE